jgi:phospholipase C
MSQRSRKRNPWQLKTLVGATLLALASYGLSAAAEDPDINDHDRIKTAAPIKHVIVLIGENRTFDHVFATYEPREGQTVSDLLAKGIIHADGRPGPNFDRSRQFTVNMPLPASGRSRAQPHPGENLRLAHSGAPGASSWAKPGAPPLQLPIAGCAWA